MTQSSPSAARHGMHCMEIWGGNPAVESAVSTPGLDVWVYSRPHRGGGHGGDVHYVSLCGGGVITRMIVADVSGHGQVGGRVFRHASLAPAQDVNRKSQTRLVAAPQPTVCRTRPVAAIGHRRSWRPTWPIATSSRSVTPGIPARSGTDPRSGRWNVLTPQSPAGGVAAGPRRRHGEPPPRPRGRNALWTRSHSGLGRDDLRHPLHRRPLGGKRPDGANARGRPDSWGSPAASRCPGTDRLPGRAVSMAGVSRYRGGKTGRRRCYPPGAPRQNAGPTPPVDRRETRRLRKVFGLKRV